MSGVYGGDEVGALVFDPGCSSLRVGYAGEDNPKFDIPAHVGVVEDPDTSEKKYFIDTVHLNVPRKNCEVVNYMKDGMIEDWTVFEKVLDYAYEKCIKSESQYHPIVFSEASWNGRGKRERLCELVFEKYQVPAFFLVKSAVLSAFANGRSTGLVLDSGATHTSAVPVHDGYVLQHAIIKSPLGGDFLVNQALNFLKETDLEITPPYMIADKTAVKEGDKAKWTKKSNLPEPTQSWLTYQQKEVVKDFTNTMLHCSETPYDFETIVNIPTEPYEFPNGYNNEFGIERYKITEALFDPSYIKGVSSTMLGMSHVVSTSIGLCDIDLRPSLYSGVVVTGGNTLLTGFIERLNRDLSSRTPPNMKFKLIAASESAARRFGAWNGGSILASLGSFQQMWISKQEYEEAGKSQIDRKCP
ncbi:Actin-like protein 6A [Armadillidium nasatum]|uniref:Actin-like protein 6A n=1 Tax=Armadillidium nasatum TaxID=96803 RepID=A0A5N5TKH1_9CRUS|nr:Actin-like protein 6A [Armadillidium nasatum]